MSIGLVSGPVYGLGFGVTGRLYAGLGLGLAGPLSLGFSYGGSAVIKHVILRHILFRNGYAPRNYADFLDHCIEHDLMRRVGGGFIFRHRMLMEYFAMQRSSTPRD